MSSTEPREKKIEDYLHLYLGCECEFLTGEGTDFRHKLLGVEIDYLLHDVYRKQRIYTSIKPILRRLDSMTEQEKKEVETFVFDNIPENHRHLSTHANSAIQSAARTKYLLKKSFDLFGLIDSGQAIDAATLTKKD